MITSNKSLEKKKPYLRFAHAFVSFDDDNSIEFE